MNPESDQPASYTVVPVAIVRSARKSADDDCWGGTEQRLELVPPVPDCALFGLETFSHAEITFLLDGVPPDRVTFGPRHPRGNAAWPAVGIFAQRAKCRPNRLGSTIVRIVRREARALVVAELDAVDGTPVLDVKPVYREFLPRTPQAQPAWVAELVANYWSNDPGRSARWTM